MAKFRKWHRKLLTAFLTCIIIVPSLLQCMIHVNHVTCGKVPIMDTDLERLCSYAPYTSVLTVIRHIRERNLKEPVTSLSIATIGVAEGNASRTIQALRFLNLLDEGGYITPTFKLIENAPDSEYPEVLGQILRDAYKHVFMALDPATATDQQFENAFRYYQPKAQRSRMIMLFKGLCREASLISGGAPETISRPRTTSPKPLVSANASKRGQPKSDSSLLPEPFSPPTGPAIRLPPTTTTGTTQELIILQGLLIQLPFATKQWTQSRHDKWIQAMTAAVDLLFEIVDPITGDDGYSV